MDRVSKSAVVAILNEKIQILSDSNVLAPLTKVITRAALQEVINEIEEGAARPAVWGVASRAATEETRLTHNETQ